MRIYAPPELGLTIYELLGRPVRERIALWIRDPLERTSVPDAIADAKQIRAGGL